MSQGSQSPSKYEAPAASASAAPSPDARSTEFRPVEKTEVRSGEVLLVEAYAVIWIILFGLVLFSFRRQKRLDSRIDELTQELAKVKRAKGGE